MDNERLFVGNIMQRTWSETDSNGTFSQGSINCFIVEENAILYKTDNGGYVEFDMLQQDSDYIEVNRIIIKDGAEISENGIKIMPSVELSRVEEPTVACGSRGILGRFIDSESLKNYNEFQNDDNAKLR